MFTVVGSLNMDLTLEVSRFPQPGETIRGHNFRSAHGGKGANQAYAVAKMGLPVAMIGAVGADSFGAEMVEGLAEVGVDVSKVLHREDTASGTALITVDAAGQNQIVVANGANDTLSAADIAAALGDLGECRALLLQLEVPLPAVVAAIELGHGGGIPVFLNTAPCLELPDAVLNQCDWIIANEQEATQLTRQSVTSPAEAGFAATGLRQRAPRAGIVITLGAAGAWIDSAAFTGHVPGFAVETVDSVGAGDAWIGAFATQLLEGQPVERAARFAHLAAAIAVTRRGAQTSIPGRPEVEADPRAALLNG
jgi:ribokinase